jgi:hypothetical protein
MAEATATAEATGVMAAGTVADQADRFAIRELVENWALWPDAEHAAAAATPAG